MGLFSSSRTVKEAGRNSFQQRRANGESYRKQAAKSMGRSIKNQPQRPKGKGGW